jgi:hypothetical protein
VLHSCYLRHVLRCHGDCNEDWIRPLFAFVD